MNIGKVLTETARRASEQTATIFGDVRRTYGQLNARANQLASALKESGLRQGDRVAIIQRNCPELLETLFGVFKAGAVAVPINARLHPKEYRYIVDHAGARVVIFTQEFSDGIESIRDELQRVERFICVGPESRGVEAYEDVLLKGRSSLDDAMVAPDDVAWLFYTSGTTGRPKGAMITHENLEFMTRRYFEEVYPLSGRDVGIHAGPLTHGSGLWALPIIAGGAAHVIPHTVRFDPELIFRLIAQHRVTKIVFVAPTMITLLLNSPALDKYDLSSLRFIGYGGSPMYVEDLKRAIKQLGSILCQIYGQGECPMTISMLSAIDHVVTGDPRVDQRLASAGRPRGGIEVAVLGSDGGVLSPGEIGEIAVRGPVVMRGYWNDDKATNDAFQNGWYHTGDVGRFDEAGYLYLLDRKKDFIISGGSNIYPREVEEVLLLHPGVLEVAVFGVPDRLWGESVLALVVRRPGARPTEEELVQLCRGHLAAYKKPRYVRFVESLPKNAYGKVLKRELRQQYAGEYGERAG